jgi:hypothetical protein
MKKKISEDVLRNFVDAINEAGNTGATFIELAAKYDFKVSDLGSVSKEGNKYTWNVEGVGKLVQLENHSLIIE